MSPSGKSLFYPLLILPSSHAHRLYAKAIFTGFKRGQRTQKENTALVNIQGCQDRKSSSFYHGKRIAYIFKKNNLRSHLKYKCIWGKVTASHGQSGVVRAVFKKHLPPRAMGSALRVMLYPNKLI